MKTSTPPLQQNGKFALAHKRLPASQSCPDWRASTAISLNTSSLAAIPCHPPKDSVTMGTLPLAGLSRLLRLGWEVVIEGEPAASGAPTTVDALHGLTSATSRAMSFPVFQFGRRTLAGRKSPCSHLYRFCSSFGRREFHNSKFTPA